ncbi:MAG TPA: hypothetical protein VFR15_07705, partial [Chloroflexia bacterium]|nr:hypothetical protein [Chloroflexia bacterium]
RFEGPPRDAYGWDASGAGARLEQDDAGGRRVALANNGEGELIYASAVGPVNEGLYAVQLETQTRLESGAGRMFLQCIDANGDWIAVAPDAMGRTLDDTGGRWRVVRQAVACPAGTERIRVDLRNGGKGEVAFRQVTLWKLGP